MSYLRNDPSLARFLREGTATGRQLGSGAYGSVEEVTVNHLPVVGTVMLLLYVAKNINNKTQVAI